MQAFLESFKSADEVYQECKKRGLKGEQRRACACILVELLKSEYPERFEDGKGALVSPDFTRSDEGEVFVTKPGGGFLAEYALPRVMNEFAIAFDHGKYPDLVKDAPNG